MVERLAPCYISRNHSIILSSSSNRKPSSTSLSAPDNVPIFLQDDMKILMSVASSPTLPEDPTQLDPLLSTESWQVLMTFTRESARALAYFTFLPIFQPVTYLGPSRPSTSAPSISAKDGNNNIPQEVFDQVAAEDALRSASTSVGANGRRICPHCTFENAQDGGDCEVCGLPLS